MHAAWMSLLRLQIRSSTCKVIFYSISPFDVSKLWQYDGMDNGNANSYIFFKKILTRRLGQPL